MAKIEFSQGFMSGLPARIAKDLYSYSGLDLSREGFFTQHNNKAGILSIFNGIRPSMAVYKSTSSTYINNNRLISFSGRGGSSINETDNNILRSADASGIKFLSSLYVPAIRTGEATWFSFHKAAGPTSPYSGHAIIGTVGGLGSGADLEISVPNMLLGQLYCLDRALTLTFPSSWEY